MKQQINDIWSKIDGWKTAGAMVLLIILKGITLIFPDFIKPELEKCIEDLLYLIGGFAVGHKVSKSFTKKV